jgi:3,4-dihydroxy 2-butanone 4-phosphate synthase / GTP cyclohydrolase II
MVAEARTPVTDFGRIERAVADIAAGRAVVVVDDEDRENEGDLIFAAEKATPELLAFMVRYTSGYICVPLTEPDCDRLDLPPMYHTNQDRRGTAYTVTVDAANGVSTGISATDRAHTIRLLADPASQPRDFNRPGHVVPLRAKEGGVLRRPGTPRPRSTWPDWPACDRPVCCASWSARRTRATWPGGRSWRSSQPSTISC